MSSLPVVKVLHHLFECLYDIGDSKELHAVTDAIRRVSLNFPQEYSAVVFPILDSLSPGSDHPHFVRFLSHFGCVDPQNISSCVTELLMEKSILSLYSVDGQVRRAGVVALRTLALAQPEESLARLVESMKLYRVNFEFLEVLKILIFHQSRPEFRLKVMLIIKYLLTTDRDTTPPLSPSLLGGLCQCISLICDSVDGNFFLLDQDVLEVVFGLVSPFCWDRVLSEQSPSEGSVYAEIVRATVGLISVIDVLKKRSSKLPIGSLRSVQSAVVRLTAVHAKTAVQLVLAVDSLRILIQAHLLVHDDETTGLVMQLLIDLGVGLGPLTFWLADKGVVQKALDTLMGAAALSTRGVSFLIDRFVHGPADTGDKLVTLHYLKMALENRSSIPSVDSLVTGMENVCESWVRNFFSPRDAPPHMLFALVELLGVVAGPSSK